MRTKNTMRSQKNWENKTEQEQWRVSACEDEKKHPERQRILDEISKNLRQCIA